MDSTASTDDASAVVLLGGLFGVLSQPFGGGRTTVQVESASTASMPSGPRPRRGAGPGARAFSGVRAYPVLVRRAVTQTVTHALDLGRS
jgi:hypothetical protein